LIYNFDKLVDTPIDIIPLVKLRKRLNAFTFMEYSSTLPNFHNSQVVEVTKRAVKRIGNYFRNFRLEVAVILLWKKRQDLYCNLY